MADTSLQISPTASRYVQRARLVLYVCLILLNLIALLVLVGWAIQNEYMKRVFPGLVEMNPVSALLFMFSSAGLFAHLLSNSLARKTVTIAFASIVMAVGLIRFQSHFTQFDPKLDRIFFSKSLGINRMAPNSALCFAIVGLAILTINVQLRRGFRPAQWMALIVFAVALIALLGYAYHAQSFYQVTVFIPMALHTAVCMVLLSIAILCLNSKRGIMVLFTSDSPGGSLFRRTIPFVLIIPALLGWLILNAFRNNRFGVEMAISLFAVMVMALFSMVVWLNSYYLQKADTARQQAEENLSIERNLLRGLIDNLPDHIYIKDTQGRYIIDNSSHAKFVGAHGPSEVLGKTVYDFFPKHMADAFTADDQFVIRTREAIVAREEAIVDREGHQMWVATTKVPLLDSDQRSTGLVCISRDITRRKLAEREMAEVQDFLSSIIENLPNMLFVKDATDLRFVRFNRAGEELLGVPRKDLIGKNDYDIFPENEADFFIAKDRQVLWSGQMLDIPSEPIDTKTGRRFLHTKKIPIVRDGKPKYLLGISEDITDRVEAEEQLREQNIALQQLAAAEKEANSALKKAQSQLVQSEKLAGLGQLVAGVAHEINNPLSFVANNVAVIQRDLKSLRTLVELYGKGAPALASAQPDLMKEITELSERIDLNYTLGNLDEMLLRSRDGLKRIQQIVRDLRDFARLDESDLQEADLNAGVESTANIIKVRAKHKHVELKIETNPLPLVTCYPAKINQVIMNLVSNAIDACKEGGQVIIRTRAVKDEVVIQVADNGSGIPPEIQHRIFDPFFTTKPQGEGTGLGLSISYGIIRDHKGRIDVESEVDHGTTFTIRLPVKGPKSERA